MSIIESLRSFFLSCPYLKDGRLNIDFLGHKACEYTIDGVPADIIVKRYLDGATVRQYEFVFASREEYGFDVLQAIANSSFYENVAAWLEQQSDLGILPKLKDGQQAIKIEALSSGYLYQGSENTARYQIQCRLLYNQSY